MSYKINADGSIDHGYEGGPIKRLATFFLRATGRTSAHQNADDPNVQNRIKRLATRQPDSPRYSHNLFHTTAERWDEAQAKAREGNILGAVATTFIGGLRAPFDAAGTTVKHQFNNSVQGGIMNNVVCAIGGGVAGSIAGYAAGSIVTAAVKIPVIGTLLGAIARPVLMIAGGLGGAALGFLKGDMVMRDWLKKDLEGGANRESHSMTAPGAPAGSMRIRDHRPPQTVLEPAA